ncbi:homoserine dehydrogenase [Ornithinimicrobium cerasi]|uniref:Homoserine dehydrogenase n=1 Tax=Ornithinimicrobium cerasi TaxID=2248773 RepID=A0A285VFG8_9MICO|nr:homoserine dehydrogenase [Ornithinimicrobium cerasi]SOC52809.1 homoserine dehydrogenase [Ornithinimicrobium cerasi]
MSQTVRIALLGAGTVGAAVARRLCDPRRADLYAARVGRPLELVGVAVRDTTRSRDGIDPALLTADASGLVERADVVVEVMGGLDPAPALLEQAMRCGAQVVTANKQLLAQQGPRLEALAAENGVGLDYEAAVMAAIPVVAVVRDSLAGDLVTSISGIVNGSTNYVLDLVARKGVAFDDAVRQAGELGYLEADPTEDLEGLDAAAKIVLLARAAWGADVSIDDVQRTGITGLTDDDFETAAANGKIIKLVASAWRSGPPENPRVEMGVRPVALPQDDPLAQAREGANVVIIEAESAGRLRLHGAGAGGEETASAVLGDIVRAARRVVRSA